MNNNWFRNCFTMFYLICLHCLQQEKAEDSVSWQNCIKLKRTDHTVISNSYREVFGLIDHTNGDADGDFSCHIIEQDNLNGHSYRVVYTNEIDVEIVKEIVKSYITGYLLLSPDNTIDLYAGGVIVD